MKTRGRWTLGTVAALVVAGVAGAMLATDSHAMGGRAPSAEPIQLDGIEQGYSLGRRNGDILVDRVRDRTVGIEGCRGVRKMQDTLTKVTRSIRAPLNSSEGVTIGFYRGYLDSVREAIRDTRRGCNISRFDDGLFAGELYGSLLCQVGASSKTVLASFEIESLYDGWSGGSREVIGECLMTASLILDECGGMDDSLSILIETGCSDSL